MATREMTLAEIQDFGIKVLEEFDSFCKNNNLRYSLAYGTLIGAIRHKGYIPWDDDIDVMMPRPDYEKLIRAYHDTPDFQILYPGKNDCSLQYARLCDMSRTCVKSKSPWHSGENGVWIDIFPIDAAPEDLGATTKKYLRCHALYRDLLARRRTLRYKAAKDFVSQVKYLAHLLGNKTHAPQYALALDQCCGELPYGSTNRLINFSSPMFRKVFTYPFDKLEEYTDVDFCGKKFRSVKDYDFVLRAQYGDYMQLPPESQRVPGHSCHDYIWKDSQI